jgi:3-isopropylmalate/(R)-2-methylmalate dehydratase small subunit
MEPFVTHKGIPKQFLRKIERTGFGVHLFHEWRYNDYEGTKENPDFVLNKAEYRKATVLLARDNFGCGSSREHAPWALVDYGFRVIIAPSFADIFYNNCVKNGILLVRLNSVEVDAIFKLIESDPGGTISADLNRQTVTAADGKSYSFEIDHFAKHCLLNGLDQIGWTLQFEDEIKTYENKLKSEKPWLVE